MESIFKNKKYLKLKEKLSSLEDKELLIDIMKETADIIIKEAMENLRRE